MTRTILRAISLPLDNCEGCLLRYEGRSPVQGQGERQERGDSALISGMDLGRGRPIHYDRLYVLNSVQDAKLFLSEDHRIDECLVCSTHASVNDYLNVTGIEAIHLSSLVDDKFTINQLKVSDHFINELLHHVDAALSGLISGIVESIRIDYFHALYSYPLKCDHIGYSHFKHALKQLCATHLTDEVVFYGSADFALSGGIRKLVEHDKDLEGIRFEFVMRKSDAPQRRLHNLKRQIAHLYHLGPSNALSKVSEKLRSKIEQRYSTPLYHDRRTIILMKELYDLAVLNHEVQLKEAYNIIVWPNEETPHSPATTRSLGRDKIAAIESVIDNIDVKSSIPRLRKDDIHVAEYMLEDFRRNIHKSLTSVLHVDRIHQEFGIELCIWGNPPIGASKSLVCEYLLRSGIPVVGMQHGGAYCVQNYPGHFDSDFSRCTHYLSYGFDETDLQLAYPDRCAPCKIIPAGSSKESESACARTTQLQNRSEVDILFPITNCASIFGGPRINAAQLAMYQVQLLDLLETITDLSITVKPMRGYSADNYAVCEKLKRLSHVKINPLSLRDFLRLYSPKLVIMEYPSTPLFEVIGLDVDIFLMLDPVTPFTTQAVELLRKRIHMFENIEDMKNAILRYRKGQMPKLRNSEFYNKHVYKKNTKKIIMRTIDSVITHKRDDPENTGHEKGIKSIY